MSPKAVTLFLCALSLTGCANRTLQGEWLCLDGMAAPPGLARMIFTDASHVTTDAGKTLEYEISGDDTLILHRENGVEESYKFERMGDNLNLSRSGRRHAYVRQL
jgi:hypothetical protein